MGYKIIIRGDSSDGDYEVPEVHCGMSDVQGDGLYCGFKFIDECTITVYVENEEDRIRDEKWRSVIGTTKDGKPWVEETNRAITCQHCIDALEAPRNYKKRNGKWY